MSYLRDRLERIKKASEPTTWVWKDLANMILKADYRDIDELVRLEIECFSYDRITMDEFQKHIRNHNCDTMIMRSHGFLVGYGLVIYTTKSSSAWLYSLCSKNNKAWIILEHLELSAKARGMRFMRLEVKESNKDGIVFYERNGYRLNKRYRRGRIYDFYDDGSTALSYIKKLG